jgi:hypothetical protein
MHIDSAQQIIAEMIGFYFVAILNVHGALMPGTAAG